MRPRDKVVLFWDWPSPKGLLRGTMQAANEDEPRQPEDLTFKPWLADLLDRMGAPTGATLRGRMVRLQEEFLPEQRAQGYAEGCADTAKALEGGVS